MNKDDNTEAKPLSSEEGEGFSQGEMLKKTKHSDEMFEATHRSRIVFRCRAKGIGKGVSKMSQASDVKC